MKNAKRNWKTSLVGGLLVALGLAQVATIEQPTEAEASAAISAIVAGVGLIAAKDGDKSGTAPKSE